MVSVFFTNFIKTFVSGVLSLTMALTPAMSGPAKKATELSAKVYEYDIRETAAEFRADIDASLLSYITDEDFSEETHPDIYENGTVTVQGKFVLITDVDNGKCMLEFTDANGKPMRVYADGNAFALSPETTKAIINFTEDENYIAAYDEYFADNGFYFDMSELFGEEVAPEEMQLLLTVFEKTFEVLQDPEIIKDITDYILPVLKQAEGYYSEVKDDGTVKYTCKMTGTQIVDYLYNIYSYTASDAALEKSYNISLKALKKLAHEVDIDEFNKNAEETGISIDNVLDTPEAKAEYFATTKDSVADILPVLEVLKTGKDTYGIFNDNPFILLVLSQALESSYIESAVYEKDGKICEDSKFVIAASGATLVSLELKTGTREYKGNVPSPAEAVPFDKRLETEEMDNKVAYKMAENYGVNNIEISWISEMLPEMAAPELSYADFYVSYNVSEYEIFKNSDEYKTMTEEEKLDWDRYYEEWDGLLTQYADSSAYLIDGSVYLPLRQIMEHAGYEVSWDADARKAYVTVDGAKVDMTGTIINDRTYVKVRDFEKLGAKVDYNEDFYRQDAYNDFEKYCEATITFAK